ncbi:MAG TPA: arsenic transporter [Pseudobacteroides sp.]|uniref:arsenic transporter n=1 Tax=Pseudobacteroides sp. TaxID=1968840 RepID=UPI002F9578BB
MLSILLISAMVLIFIMSIVFLVDDGPPTPRYTLHHKEEIPDKKRKEHPRLKAILLVLLIQLSSVMPFIIIGYTVLATIMVFLVTILIIFIRPKGLNEAYPALIGACIIIIMGVVSYTNMVDIVDKISGASITIIATIVMTVVLESFGFFYWAALTLAKLSKGSGYRLFWNIQILCFLMTLLFNNDGSILITTPILILLLKNMKLMPHQQIPYLISGALIATASSAPIGVSNIVNLISLNIVNISLYEHTAMMFVPATIGLLFMSLCLFLLLKKRLVRVLPEPDHKWDDKFFAKKFTFVNSKISFENKSARTRFMFKILLFVFSIRCSLFIASFLNIPISIVAVAGSIALLILRWHYFRIGFFDILRKTPWHILLFAFSMYVIIFGLNNIGMTNELVNLAKPMVKDNLFNANFIMGVLISVFSNIFNNHPALMVGTITLQAMELPILTMKTVYLANIIGSDIGSLLLPIGTLASLIWMNILKENNIKIKWKDYIGITIIVIPITLVFTLTLLYFWVHMVFI